MLVASSTTAIAQAPVARKRSQYKGCAASKDGDEKASDSETSCTNATAGSSAKTMADVLQVDVADRTEAVHCWLRNQWLHGPEQYELHILGKKHKKKLLQNQEG